MSTHQPELLHPEVIVVSCTVPNESSAQCIAELVLHQRLGACVQSHPITSQYWWGGEVQRDSEVMLTIKTTRDRYDSLEAAILRAHPYEVAEIVAVPVAAGSADYLAWISAAANASPSS